MSIFREFNINMIPGKPPLIIHVSQYESDFVYTFNLVSGKSVLAIPDTAIAVIRGTKRDGNGYSVEAALDAENHKVVVMGDVQMTACAGKNVFELAIINDEKVICTANFFLDVERAPLDAGTIQSESVLRELQAIIDSAETATQAAEEASASAESAASAAEQAVEEKFEEGVAETIDEWLTDHPEATTTVQDGSITEAKLATALKNKTINNYVTPEMFGAVGDGTADDTQALQAAVNTGKCVCTKGNTYKVTSPINVSGKRVDFNGASLLFSGQCAVLASGTLKGTTSLSANVTSGSVLSLADTSEIEDGDILVIEDENNIFTAERSYYYNGGTFLVSAVVSSGSVAVTPTVDFKQYSGATVFIYSPATCDISGIADISSINADDYFDAGIMLKACNSVRIHDCACESDLYAWASVDCSVNTYFDNVNLDVKLTRFPVTKNVYGIILGASSYSYIGNCVMSSDWHCVTTGAAVGGSNRVTPTQHTYIADSSLATNSGNASGVAYGAHPNGYKSVFTNCHIVGCMVYNGAIIKECEISSPSAGSALFINGCSQDSIRPDVVIENCKISGIRTRRATQFVSDWTSYIGNIIIKDSKYTRFENVSDSVDIISLQIDGGYGFLFDWDSKDTHIGTVVIRNVKLKNITQANRVYGDTDCLIIENLYVDNTGVESGGFVIKIDPAGVVHLNDVYVVGAFTFTINNATYFFDNFYSSGTLAASSGEGSTNVYITNSVWKASQSFRTNTALLNVVNSKSLNTDIADADVITYNGSKYKKTFNGTQFVFAAL